MKVLVIQQRYGIGDMVIFTPYFQAISKKLKTPLTILAKDSSRAKDLYSDDNHIKKIITLDASNDGLFGTSKLINQLKSEKFDKVFIFNNSFRYRIVCILAGIKEIFQYKNSLFKKNDVIFETAKHFTESCLKEQVSTQSNIIVKNRISDNKKIKSFFNEIGKIIVLGISASGPTKRWDLENYSKLIKNLSELCQCKFILAGGKNDQILINKVIDDNNEIKFFSLADMTIKDSLPILKKAEAYIGNDTGFLHLCAALGINSLGLFMDSPAHSYSGYSPKINVVVPEDETIESTSHNTRGKNNISFDKVLEKSKEILSI